MTSLLELEPAVHSYTQMFRSRPQDFADKKGPIDLEAWLQYYAFDMVGELTFARKLGFL